MSPLVSFRGESFYQTSRAPFASSSTTPFVFACAAGVCGGSPDQMQGRSTGIVYGGLKCPASNFLESSRMPDASRTCATFSSCRRSSKVGLAPPSPFREIKVIAMVFLQVEMSWNMLISPK